MSRTKKKNYLYAFMTLQKKIIHENFYDDGSHARDDDLLSYEEGSNASNELHDDTTSLCNKNYRT